MAAGDQVPWGYIAQRIDQATITANSATWTTTTSGALASVTGFVTAGRRYKLGFRLSVASSSVASPSTEASIMIIREDVITTGTQVAAPQIYIPTASSLGFSQSFDTEWIAASTGSKTFVLQGTRISGAGNHSIAAATTRPGIFTLDLVPV